jgi:putative phosphoribosyl transferase
MRRQHDEIFFRRTDIGRRLLADRREAGALLARQLTSYRGRHALILGLPRGGVPVAAEVARVLHADLDVLASRKLGAPGQDELAIGAITADGTRYLDSDLVQGLGVSDAYVEEVSAREQLNAQRQEQLFRSGLPALEIDGREVIVVDDGLATGATMRAAVWSLRRGRPKKVVVAVPVGAPDSCASIDAEVDDFICLHSEQSFASVGMYYRDFTQVSDQRVIALLHDHRQPPSPVAALLRAQRGR